MRVREDTVYRRQQKLLVVQGQRVSSSTGDVVEVIARIPHVATRVAITVET